MSAASLPRDQLGVRCFPDLWNWRLDAAFTGTLEAYLHKRAPDGALLARLLTSGNGA